MAKIICTGEQIDSAIQKVKNGYADVSKVTAKPSDVRQGKIFVDANKVEQTGTLGNGSIEPRATVPNNPYLTNTPSEYSVAVTPRGQVRVAGYQKSGSIPGSASATKYIQTEEKEVDGSDTAFDVFPTIGKLLSKVTIKRVSGEDAGGIDNMPTPSFSVYFSSSSASGSYRRAYYSSGVTMDNIYVKSGVAVSDAHVYLMRISSTTSSSYKGGTGTIIDATTGLPTGNTIEIKPGESRTISTGSSLTVRGTITYTLAGRLTIKLSSTYYVFSRYTTYTTTVTDEMPMIFEMNGGYYVLVLDSRKWESGSETYGSYTTNVTGCTSSYKSITMNGTTPRDYTKAETLMSNIASVNFYVVWSGSTVSTYPTVRVGTPTNIPILLETAVLQTPSISIQNGVVSWNAIPNATSYTVFARSASTVYSKTGITDMSYTLSSLITAEGTYEITVQAKGDNIGSPFCTPVSYDYVKT